MSLAVPVWLLVQEQLHGIGVLGSGSSTCFDDFNDEALFELLHLTKPCVAFVTDSIRLHLKASTTAREELSLDAQVMVALNYYAHGVFSGVVLDAVGLSNQSERAYLIVDKLSGVIVGMSAQFMSFPKTLEAKVSVASNIKKISGIPNALGILALAHFKITQSPQDKSSMSASNVKDETSVELQVICDTEGQLLSVGKCRLSYGSTMETETWELSSQEEEVQGPYWLIGTKGYQLSKYVLTPVNLPVTEGEIRYNKAHERLDDIMQKTLYTLNMRFRCLLHLGYTQGHALDKNSDIIRACTVLHNISQKFSVPLPNAAEDIQFMIPSKQHSKEQGVCPGALKARRKVIDEFFTVSMEMKSTEGH